MTASVIRLPRRRFLKLRGNVVELAVGLLVASMLEANAAHAESAALPAAPDASPPAGALPESLQGIDPAAVRTMSIDELKQLLDAKTLAALGLDASFPQLLDTDASAAIRKLETAFREKIKVAAQSQSKMASADAHAETQHDADAQAREDGAGHESGGFSPLYLIGGLAVVGGGIALAAGGGGGGGGDKVAPNVAPVAVNDAVTTNEDTSITFDVRTNDSDRDGGTLAVTQINGTAITTTSPVAITGGSISLGADGRLTFTPTANFNGTPSFSYTLSDGQGGTSSATVTLTVNAVNDAPVNTLPTSVAQIAQGASVLIPGLSVSDVDAGTSTMTTRLSVANGTLTAGTVANGASVAGNGSGAITLTGTLAQINASLAAINYTSARGFAGAETLTMVTNDGQATDTDTLSLTVAQVTTGVVIDGYVAGARIFFDANGNGTYDEGEVVATTDDQGRFVLVGEARGTMIAIGGINTDTGLPNTIALKAPAGSTAVTPLTTLVAELVENGVDVAVAQAQILRAFGLPEGLDLSSFDFLSQGGDADLAFAVQKVATEIATLMIQAAAAGISSTVIGEQLAQAALSGNTIDLGDPAQLSALLVAAGADPSVAEDIAFKAASINQAIEAATSPADLAETVRDLNQPGADLPPVTTADKFVTDEDKPVVIDVRANDIDPERGGLTVVKINGAPIAIGDTVTITGGTLTLGEDGNLTFQPNADFNGTPSFEYTVADAAGQETAGTADITVTPVNDAPVATADVVRFGLGVSGNVDVRINDTDVDGDALRVVAINDVAITADQPVVLANGTVSLAADGHLVFTPNQGFLGGESFTYTVTDDNGGFATATVTAGLDGPVLPVAAELLGFAADQAGALAAAGVTTLDVAGDTASIGEAQAQALIAAGIDFAEADQITLNAEGTTLNTSLKGLQSLHVDAVAVGAGVAVLAVDAGGALATLDTRDLPQFDVAQSDGALDVTLRVDGGTIDPALDLGGLAADLRAAGIDHLGVTGTGALSLDVAQAQALAGAGLDFATAADITLDVDPAQAVQLANDPALLASLHVDHLDVNGAVAITEAQAVGLIGAGVDFVAGDDVTVNVEGTHMSTSLKGLQTLHVDAINVTSGLGLLTIAAGGALESLSAADLPSFTALQSDASLDVTLQIDAGTLNHNFDMFALAPSLSASGIDHIGVAGTGELGVSLQQAWGVSVSGMDFTPANEVVVHLAASELSAVSDPGEAALLGQINVDTLDIIDDVATISDDQAANLVAAGLHFADADVVTVEAQGTHMSTSLRGLHDLKVDAVAVQAGVTAVVLDAGDLTGLSAADLPQFDLTIADDALDVTLRVDANELSEVSRLAQALSEAGIDHIMTNQDPATIDPAQAEALAAITRDFGIDFAFQDFQPMQERTIDPAEVQSEVALLTELRSGYEGQDDDGVGGVYKIADGAHHALAESGLLRAYTADTLVIDGTEATSDKLLTTLKDIADMGIDEVRLHGEGSAPVYIELGQVDDGPGGIRALLQSLEHGQDGPDPIFQDAEKVALVLDAAEAQALSQIDGATEQLKAIGFTEIDVLANPDGSGAPAFGDAGLEVKLIGQDEELYHHLHDR